MRNFSQACRKFMAASILVLALSCSVFAGEMQFPTVVQPPPVIRDGDVQYPGVDSSTETVDGDVQYPAATVDSVSGLALTLWQSAMALF